MQDQIMRVLMIGCGKMGGALLSKWVTKKDASFTIIDPALETAPVGAELFPDASGIANQTFDVVVVAIKPQLIDDILREYQSALSADGVLVSIAAGCSIARLRKAMGDVPVVRVMPNLPAAIGKGVAGLVASPDVTPAQRDGVNALMSLTGNAVWVDDEDGIDRITAVAGSGPGYVFEIANTYVEAAKALGFSAEDARTLVLGTLAGTIEMAIQSNEPLAVLRDNVTSKNGTTQAGLEALNGQQQLAELLRAATQAAYDRAVELR